MGHSQAVGMAEAVRDGLTDLDAALQYHLQVNHYPPLPNEAIGIAKDAAQWCAQDEPDRQVQTPTGLWPAWKIVQGWHLGPFVDAMSEEDEE